VPCRMRADYLHPDNIIVDLKIVRSAHEKDFQRAVANYRYDMQAAWYRRGYATIQGLALSDVSFLFLAVESEPPHAINLFEASSKMLDHGTQSCEAALKSYLECSQKNHWPGYTETIKKLDLPNWML
jgi:hypothetical protein